MSNTPWFTFGLLRYSTYWDDLGNPSAQKLSWEDTDREMAASNQNWSAWDAAINDGLGDSEISAKIEKYAGIADEKLSTEQIMNLTRE